LAPLQRAAVAAILEQIANGDEFVAQHGDCVAADAEFHDLCRALPGSFIIAPGRWMICQARPAEPAMNGGHTCRTCCATRIVVASTMMIAAPFELAQQPHGGTWRTIEMARKAKRPLAIVSPDGTTASERWEPQAVKD
jgi:hypothetical protein